MLYQLFFQRTVLLYTHHGILWGLFECGIWRKNRTLFPSSRADPKVRSTPSPSRNTRVSYQRFVIHQLMHKRIVLKTVLKFTFKSRRVPYQALHISQNHHALIVSGIRMALISVVEKIALFKSRSTLACIGRLVVIYQCPLLFFYRRKLIGVFTGCKQEWDEIRHIVTQGIILEAADLFDFLSRYQS